MTLPSEMQMKIHSKSAVGFYYSSIRRESTLLKKRNFTTFSKNSPKPQPVYWLESICTREVLQC